MCVCGFLLKIIVREKIAGAQKREEKTENDLKALQTVGQMIGEVLKQIDEERCLFRFFSFLEVEKPRIRIQKKRIEKICL